MYILVNVERHQDLMGVIAKNLIANYGVPISIVDSIQKICPKCSASCSTDDCMRSDETTENDNTNNNISSTSKHHSTSSRSSVVSNPSASSEPPMKMPKIETNAEEIEQSDRNLAESTKVTSSTLGKRPSLSFESTLAQAFQNNQIFEKANKSLSISEEASISSNQDLEDDEYTTFQLNPQLLASIISSTPNFFATASSPDNTKQSTPSSSASLLKREIPPNLTVNGKTRRGRIVYSAEELGVLEKYYLEDPNACADPVKRDQLCALLEIDYHRLKVWFQNRRRKDKIRSQTEEDGMNALVQHLPGFLRNGDESPDLAEKKVFS